MTLEFVCTGMRRPEVWRETLDSFRRNLQDVELGASLLYLNVDPMPTAGDAGRMYSIACEYFNTVVVNHPAIANFPAAVKWCYAQATSEVFFSLEDDWNLHRAVDVRDMLALLRADPSLSLVNLRAYGHDDDRLCLAPGLWRTAHARIIGERLRTNANPERQLRRKGLSNPHGGAHEGFKAVQFPRGRREIVIRDLGREWMRRNRLKREGGRLFTRWANA